MRTCTKRGALLPILFLGLSVPVSHLPAEDSTGAIRPQIGVKPRVGAAAPAGALSSAGTQAAAKNSASIALAIRNLGPAATSKQIATLVFAAVHAAPDDALWIVRSAVSAAPDAAPEIAAAAARAVPNPWKEVRYQHIAPPQNTPAPAVQSKRKGEPDFKSPVDDSSLNPGLEAIFDPAAPGDPMSLAEAIVHTAIDVDPGIDGAAVQGAVDAALFGDPGQLFNRVGGARGISGVGDAGNSNYANEPFRPNPTPISNRNVKPSAPTTPNPPPVSP